MARMEVEEAGRVVKVGERVEIRAGEKVETMGERKVGVKRGSSSSSSRSRSS